MSACGECLQVEVIEREVPYDEAQLRANLARPIEQRLSRPAHRLTTVNCAAARCKSKIRGVRILVADPEDLIRMKTASAQLDDRNDRKRAQDLDDIKVLKQLAGAATKRQTAEDLAHQRPATPISAARTAALSDGGSSGSSANPVSPTSHRQTS